MHLNVKSCVVLCLVAALSTINTARADGGRTEPTHPSAQAEAFSARDPIRKQIEPIALELGGFPEEIKHIYHSFGDSAALWNVIVSQLQRLEGVKWRQWLESSLAPGVLKARWQQGKDLGRMLWSRRKLVVTSDQDSIRSASKLTAVGTPNMTCDFPLRGASHMGVHDFSYHSVAATLKEEIATFMTPDQRTWVFSPFEVVCLQGSPRSGMGELQVSHWVEFDPSFPLFLAGGLLLYTLAPFLATSTVAHLMGGGVLGVTLSALVLLYVIYKLFLPKNRGFKVVLLTMPTLSTGLMINVFSIEQIWLYIQNYPWVWLVLALGGAASTCYVYLNPPSEKAQHLMALTLRLSGLYMMIHSCSWRPLSMGVVGTFVAFRWVIMPGLWVTYRLYCKLRGGSLRILPFGSSLHIPDTEGSVEMISRDEYDRQSKDYTQQKLNELQRHLRTNPEDYISRVTNPQEVGRWAGLG